MLLTIEAIGAGCGVSDRAAQLVSQMRSRLEGIRQRTAGAPRRSLVFIVGRTPNSLDGLVAVGKGSYLNELIQIAGGVNALAGTAVPYPKVSLEALLSLDRLVDTLVETLRSDGRLAQTWIIYTSDNGIALGEHRRAVGKSCPYEECVRVPLVIVPPGGVAAPRVDDHLVGNIDIAPTIADILGARPDFPLDGQSLVPIVEQPTASWRDAVVIEIAKEDKEEQSYQFSGVVTGNTKYVRYPSGEEELYDLNVDPYELNNVASNPSYAVDKARLYQRLLTRCQPPPPGYTP